jgi:hypothetical protein
LKSYLEKEKYLIFYYTWFRALVENIFDADIIIDINRLTDESPYRKKVSRFLKENGIEGVNFKDARITRYSYYRLDAGTMDAVEENARGLVLGSLTEERREDFFPRLSAEDIQPFGFNIEKLSPIHLSRIAEIFENMISALETEWFTQTGNKKETDYLLEQKDTLIKQQRLQLSEAIKQVSQAKQQLDKIRSSFSYRLSSAALWPPKLVRRLIKKKLAAGKEPGQVRRFQEPVVIIPGGCEKKINLGNQLKVSFGKHRSGWEYAIAYLESLHNPHGVLLDTFIERTFCWSPQGPRPNTEPWIGFIHIPPRIPRWFFYEQANEVIFASDHWKKSAPYCKGLFTLSQYHKKYLETHLDIPVDALLHPTEFPARKWTWEAFSANKHKKIVQVGWWLRKLHAIYQLPPTRYGKVFLDVGHKSLPGLMEKERELLLKEGSFNDGMYKTARRLRFLSDRDYDRLLCENIIFLYLYDASANNTVIECIARNTPLLVNPIEAVKEYLGEDYPFYYNSLEEAAHKAADMDLVHQTHRYLQDHPVKQKLTGKSFLTHFAGSHIYRNLPK